MARTPITDMTFSSIYPLYLQKVARKGHTEAELNTVISWLTGYDEQGLQEQLKSAATFSTFFAQAPQINPHASRIKGVICGVRVEDIEDPTVQQIRYLDKLVDEIAKGKKMTNILR
ncbi:DUF2200 domain-containing protein [Lacticaseibacillus sharpeae]|uniref:DUF2200 domain-containing protein n=1 Tax=Lacticaseibacillus sharpeae JCM 1186 = DSM 20505 TaxID=1291052 RepID=A0A0R1ZIS9_9LACO|nr:DUF2200 domain-containing protein [Lacticaseibacillus sharpeae]KRM54250.1 hypothetical protein FC18_GL000469 [Lacticaseibacillus sharpeae JCM 1186 = DSM 20505]